MRKVVLFIGASPGFELNRIYGGSIMTSSCFFKAFKNDPEFIIKYISRDRILTKRGLDNIKRFIQGCDILHVDDTRVVALMLQNKIQPDVIGPITRSPVKRYKGWKCQYRAEDFYKSTIIRLNNAEEILTEYEDKLVYINHGVDTEYLKPINNSKRKYVVWAGQKARSAKNFSLFEKIMDITSLSKPYEFKILSSYDVGDYWKILDETILLVNTSKYESFCCSMFEAKAKGIPTIYKNGLHKNVHYDCRIQVDYTPSSYKKMIIELLYNPELWKKEAELSRSYAVEYASLKKMRDSYAKVYNDLLASRNKK